MDGMDEGQVRRNNTLSLHWIDKNWERSGRGYAKNLHLIIDFDGKRYRFLENYCMPDFEEPNRLEVIRKSDLIAYARDFLEPNGFVETKEEILR